jgi:hypothetical protein
MNKSSNCKITMFVALGVAALISSCHFPYQPKPFVLPEQPYQFPSSTDIGIFFNTTNVKIIYTLNGNNGRDVYYVDFNDSAPAPKKLIKPAGKETSNADSPLLSRDGSFVAYYLTPDGTHTDGAYIQKLDPTAQPELIAANGNDPHWWVDTTDTSNIYVIYSDQIEVGNLTSGSGQTYIQKVSLVGSGSLQGAANVIASYPMNGGMSKDGRYLCTGYTEAEFYDRISNHLTPINGPISGYKQVCNPSIDPDTVSIPRMMFLNFSGIQQLINPLQDSSDFPADGLGNLPLHAVLFIVDINNTVKDFVPISIMGSGYGAWQCPEWSNKPNFAAALAKADENTNIADGVIIKNLGDHSIKKETLVFTRGNGKLNSASTPYVWIGN